MSAELLPDLVDRFDFTHLEPLPPTFITADWRRRESDLLFRLPFLPQANGEPLPPVLVCLLLEHQTAPDPAMPLRILLYAALFWEREWKAWEGEHPLDSPLRLTPILPIVFHTGTQRWRTYRTLAELIGRPRGVGRIRAAVGAAVLGGGRA